ncbi:MBL fold metallo-hydrolase [Caulobacter sp. ErkDOM-E]|uniref:MBL fold metallo-hydrolase n=1 Tax=Caulobacter sp. ErkDOM-E TaxID=3402778 RepID=UPI003AF81A91
MLTQRPLAALIAAATLAVAHGAAAQSPLITAPEAQSFKLGDFTLTALRDAGFEAPNNGKVFAINATPEAVSQVLTRAGAPGDKITLSVDALLVKTPGHLALFDTGLGPSAKGVLVQSLAKAGVTPDQITDVLITHGHFDHVGGLVGADGKSAFPKATIRMASAEWASLQGQAPMKPLVEAIAAQVKTFEPDAALFPGVRAVAIKGHTPGHVGYEIASGGQALLDIGDTAHSEIVSLARPDWVIAFDGDVPVATASRIALLKTFSASGGLIFSPHFPFPGVGKVEAAGEGFVWKAGIPVQDAHAGHAH